MIQFNALIVDTSVSMRSYVKEILHNELGFNEIHEAKNADDAFQLLESGHEINWIFSSLEMPGLSPLDLLENTRNDPNGKNTRFVLMSSNEELQTREIAILKGATDYLCKPFVPSQLINMVHRLTGLADRRNAKRLRIEQVCEIDIGFDSFHHYGGKLTDISMFGCRIKTSKLKPGSGYVDDLATVTLQLERGTTFHIQAKIKRVNFIDDCIDPLSNTEMALEFIAITPALSENLESFLNSFK